MYDITQKSSFTAVESWLSSINTSTKKHHEMFLVGNKIDKAKDRIIAKKLAMQYAHNKKMHFQEVSVMNSSIPTELLERITFLTLEKKTEKRAITPKAVPNTGQENICGACNVT
jgi:GTPase SAR1 family protein